MEELSIQKKVISEYMRLRENPPLRVIANDTGIQITRIHRILRGHEMKLSEYELFANVVKKYQESENFYDTNEFVNLAKVCFDKLSLNCLQELQYQMERELMTYELVSER